MRSIILCIALNLVLYSRYGLANPLPSHHIGAAENDQTGPNQIVRPRAPEPSPYPYGDPLPGEFQYRGWDPDDKTQKENAEKIHNAFGEWRLMAAAALEEVNIQDSPLIPRWFGQQDDPDDQKRVFANMWDKDGDSPAEPVSKMICDVDDFSSRCGANTAAYTIGATGEFHVCDFSLKNRPLNSGIQCGNLDDSCSAKMRSLPMTLLHEMTHFASIGEEARNGFGIVDDLQAGAYNCFTLDDTDKGDNAQNYAWFAGDAYWSRRCNRPFNDPAEGVRATGEDEAPSLAAGYGTPQCYGTVAFSQEEATTAIGNFCDNPDWQGTAIVPLVSFGSGKTSAAHPKALGVENNGAAVNDGNNTLWLDISFAESDCTGFGTFNSTACKGQLGTILNGCNTGGLFPKTGGWIEDTCLVYRMIATESSEFNPMYIQASDGDMGDWTCEATDLSIYPAGTAPTSLKDTCTCWYSRQNSVTDEFDEPDDGCSAVPEGAIPKLG